jgi:hypothetical protein
VWKSISASEHGLMMARLADLIEENKEMFATGMDNGTSTQIKQESTSKKILTIFNVGKPYHVALKEDLHRGRIPA